MTPEIDSGWHSGISAGRLLGAHDPGQPGHREGVALRHARAAEQVDDGRAEEHATRGDRRTRRDVLAGDVDHPGGAGVVDVGEAIWCGHQNSSSSSRTCTISPAWIAVTSAGTSISALAAARSPMRCEPWPPTGETKAPPRSVSWSARTSWTRPSGEEIAVGEAGARGGAGVGQLAHHPADRGQHEHLEGDVGGDRVAGQGEDRGVVLADGAEALRLAGLHADAAEPHGALVGQRLLDHVEVALAHAATGHDDVGADELVVERLGEGVRLVGDDADAVGDRAGRAGGRGEEVGVAVVDRVVAQRGAGVAQLGAGRDDDHPRTGTRTHGGAADGGEQAEVAGAEDGPLLEEHVALGDVVAHRPDVLALACGLEDLHLGDAAVGPLVGDDGGGTGRHRGAGHDLDGRAGRDGEDRGLAGADLPDDGQPDGRVLARTGHVVGQHGVAVHGRVVEAGQRDGGDHVLGERQAQRLHQGLREGRQRRDRGQDPVDQLGDRKQVSHPCPARPRPASYLP